MRLPQARGLGLELALEALGRGRGVTGIARGGGGKGSGRPSVRPAWRRADGPFPTLGGGGERGERDRGAGGGKGGGGGGGGSRWGGEGGDGGLHTPEAGETVNIHDYDDYGLVSRQNKREREV
jgi:hypothetical protein